MLNRSLFRCHDLDAVEVKLSVAAPNLILAPTQPPTPLQVLPLLTPRARWYSRLFLRVELFVNHKCIRVSPYFKTAMA